MAFAGRCPKYSCCIPSKVIVREYQINLSLT